MKKKNIRKEIEKIVKKSAENAGFLLADEEYEILSRTIVTDILKYLKKSKIEFKK